MHLANHRIIFNYAKSYTLNTHSVSVYCLNIVTGVKLLIRVGLIISTLFHSQILLSIVNIIILLSTCEIQTTQVNGGTTRVAVVDNDFVAPAPPQHKKIVAKPAGTWKILYQIMFKLSIVLEDHSTECLPSGLP